MKIVSPSQMSSIEAQAYRQGASEADFMEEAGSGVALAVHDYAEVLRINPQILLLCGKGNNAGDAYVAGQHLLQLDYEVTAIQLFPINDSSDLCRHHHFQFVKNGGKVRSIEETPDQLFAETGIIIDGIFGTGFHGKVPEEIAQVITKANESRRPIFAVDIPSGLNGETGQTEGAAIIATYTTFLGLPKSGFFLQNGWNHVGKLRYIDFGLSQELIEQADSDFVMLSPDMMHLLLPPLVRNRHKYEAGLVVGLAGSPNLPGAALLSSIAALRSGAGIVKLLYPATMQGELAASPYELIKLPYQTKNHEDVAKLLSPANAVFIGPGLGLSQDVVALLSFVIPKLQMPSVIDADALTAIAQNKIALPQNAVLTPHMGELKRLMQINAKEQITLDMEFLKQCRSFATDKKTTLVVKGGPSFICHPGKAILVCPHGDPGMATAGSGDILTGLITSLLAQGMAPHDAAALGVYLHALAGEGAAEHLSSYCMTAMDILDYLPDAFFALA